MRKMYVRFNSQENLEKFSKKINMPISILTKEVNYAEKTFKDKKRPTVKKEVEKEWERQWTNLPEFRTDFSTDEYAKIILLFSDKTTVEELSALFEQKITSRTTSVWFPEKAIGENACLRVIGGEDQPKYPIYVVSKNRAVWANWHTSKRLAQMGVYHYVVVEPQEVEKYKQVFNNKYVTILQMDMKFKEEYDTFSDLGNISSTGPGAARNFCWEHSKNNGFAWHWVLDDNINGFFQFWRGRRIKVRTAEVFRTCERFVDRYDNIAIGGLNYAKFCIDKRVQPPYVLNTRIYSMLLIRNDIPFRWRGRYNEDTDLSLRVLKDGWCTVQFNAFLGEKTTTQRIGGGNTEEFYAKEGTLNKSQMLVDMHPDVTELVWKFNRWHHEVDYSGFKQQLHLKEEFKNQEKYIVNNYGMRIVEIPKEVNNSQLDCKDYLLENFDSEEYLVDENLYLKK